MRTTTVAGWRRWGTGGRRRSGCCAGPDLLRRDAARPHPARPREEGQDRKQVPRQRVVGEAREEEDEEEAHPRRALGRLPTLLRLVQRPTEDSWFGRRSFT